MNLLRRWFPNVTQRAFENLTLLIFTLVLFTYQVGVLPPQLHIFEWWVDNQFYLFDRSWKEICREFVRFHHNDSNANVNAPHWVVLVALCHKIFSNTLLAHRIPSAVFSALAPLCLAEIVRRFYRRDLALVAGLLLAGGQNLIHFSRIAGYIAPSTTLLTALMLFTMSIVWERNRKAWLPLVLCLFLVPFMYSTVRYMALMVPGLIGWTFLTSREFRREQLKPMLISIVALFVFAIPFSEGGMMKTFVMFFSARGEQRLITVATVDTQAGEAQSSMAGRMAEVLQNTLPGNADMLLSHFQQGRRFFAWHYQEYRHTFHWWLNWIFVLGLVRALIQSFWQPRYLVWVAWSVWTWLPLMVTSGITVNRMLNGLPADFFLVALGGVTIFDALRPLLANRFRWALYVPVGALTAYYLTFSIYWYFAYLVQFTSK